MIDTVYKVLLTIINKENQGYISPEEFNLLAKNVQDEIFRGYFEDENLDKNKQNRGLSNKGYSNLPFNQRQRITPFSKDSDITGVPVGATKMVFNKPDDTYFIEQDGVVTDSSIIVEEVERSSINRMIRTEAAPTVLYPVYEDLGASIAVYPITITTVNMRYIRKPQDPKWTYTIVANKEMYDPSNASFQDFQLHESEFSNIVLRMLSFFGINLREEAVMLAAENLKNIMNQKDNQ